MDGQRRQAQNQKTVNEPSQGSLSISLATLAHRWLPYAARYQTGHPDISHSLQHVPQLANAVANPVKDTLNFGKISIRNQLPTHLSCVYRRSWSI